jgi:polyisoprenyl-teichoic acid--peptidoglycan teichoic acid transferase
MAIVGPRIVRGGPPAPPEGEHAAGRLPLAARCALLSFLWPGAGQIHAGARRKGRVIAAGACLIVAGTIALVLHRGREGLVGGAVDTRVLIAVLAGDGLLAVARLAAMLDAARLGRPARGTRTTVAVLVALIVVPHAAAGWYTYTAYDTVTAVFQEAEPTDVLEPLPDEFDVAEPGTVEPSALGRTPTPVAATPPPAGKLPAWKRRGRLNLVLLGADAGPGRSGLRTDTMMVATIDLKTRRAALFSVPRNMGGVPLPPRAARAGQPRFEPILNALHRFGSRNPKLFPGGRDPGATALKQTLGQLVGLPIDYYVLVDFRGFHALVDALGGVDVDVPRRVLDRVSPYEPGGEWIRIDLAPGRHHLGADEAFAYVRARSTSSDWDRIKRQRCVIAGIAAQTGPTTVLRSFRKLTKAFRENIRTDIPAKHLPALAKLATSIRMNQTVSIGFTPPQFTAGLTGGGAAMPDVPAIRRAVKDAIRRPPGKNDPRTIGGGACV